MDTDKLRAALEAIPAGRWAGYADVVAAAGGAPAAARRLNQLLIRDELPNAHRVLRSDGSIAPTALGDPAGVRASLVEEGIAFDDLGRAPQEARWRPERPERSEPAVAAARCGADQAASRATPRGPARARTGASSSGRRR